MPSASARSARTSVDLSVTPVDQSTRSQAVARIADRTASQHLWVTWLYRSRDCLVVHMSFLLERSL